MPDYNKLRDIIARTIRLNFEDQLEIELTATADDLEPHSHCCECTRGEKHFVHIQYPNCTCLSKDYILQKN